MVLLPDLLVGEELADSLRLLRLTLPRPRLLTPELPRIHFLLVQAVHLQALLLPALLPYPLALLQEILPFQAYRPFL